MSASVDEVFAWARENAADIAGVKSVTERDDSGVCYYVNVHLRSLAATSFEECEDEKGVWSRSVRFGHTDETVAGGHAFVNAAREQERVASEVARIARGGKS